MLPEKELPSRANRPPIPERNRFVEKPQGRKAVIPRKKQLTAILISMKRNGDWVDLVLDIENEKGEVLKRVPYRTTTIIVSSRPEDHRKKTLDTICEQIKEEYHREQACEQSCLVGHTHTGG